MLLLRCPGCKNQMKYQSQTIYLLKKKKICVYCGRSFKITGNIVKQI